LLKLEKLITKTQATSLSAQQEQIEQLREELEALKPQTSAFPAKNI